MENILKELELVSKSVSEREIDQFVELICSNNFNNIVGFGAGRMGYSLRAFIMRLTHMGFSAFMIGDTSFPKIDERSLVIVNSSSGETPTMKLFVDQAIKYNAKIVVITANENSELAKKSNYVIGYKVNKTNQIMKTIYEQFTFLFFDWVVERVIVNNKLNRSKVSKNHSISE